jgi:hypothetical protein
VQRALRATIGDVQGEDLLAARQGAEIRHRPVQPDQSQQALDETRRLPERHAEQDLHRPDMFEWRYRCRSGVARAYQWARPPPTHLGIKLNRQRPPALERVVICGPVRSLVAGGVGLLMHFSYHTGLTR